MKLKKFDNEVKIFVIK